MEEERGLIWEVEMGSDGRRKRVNLGGRDGVRWKEKEGLLGRLRWGQMEGERGLAWEVEMGSDGRRKRVYLGDADGARWKEKGG
ncbi:hypothetical protein Bpfe_016706 [Biomphalaria pfeifferi]|uniref:Uncharacterized protein n=1 Tax=Biomphalaria pfeifferi TaxID=112525 RepID=A0AAD8BGS0_BIOPF|nr:hypothetical protein Bpfe_016706 [Biomphalaria pfeifferi]